MHWLRFSGLLSSLQTLPLFFFFPPLSLSLQRVYGWKFGSYLYVKMMQLINIRLQIYVAFLMSQPQKCVLQRFIYN